MLTGCAGFRPGRIVEQNNIVPVSCVTEAPGLPADDPIIGIGEEKRSAAIIRRMAAGIVIRNELIGSLQDIIAACNKAPPPQ